MVITNSQISLVSHLAQVQLGLFCISIGKNHHLTGALIVIALPFKTSTLKTQQSLSNKKGTVMSEAYIIDAIRTPRGKGKKMALFTK